MKTRIQLISVFFLVFAVFLLFKGAVIQFLPDERLITARKRFFEKVVTIKPRRGVIYDRYGRELALSISSHSLFADPFLIKNSREISRRLSRLLKIPQRKIFKKMRNKKKTFCLD